MIFKSWLRNARPKTLLEWLILVAVVAILVAIILPGAKWASSGELNVPVVVTVFDATTIMPISKAVVGIVRAPVVEELLSNEYCENVTLGAARLREFGTITNESGKATIVQTFDTGANHNRPVSHAHTASHWVLATAEGYGTVAIPLRYQSIETKKLMSQGHLPAFVGLVKAQTN